MTKHRASLLSFAIITSITLHCSATHAAPLKLIHAGSGGGTIGGVPFGPSPFTITSLGDNDEVYNTSGGGHWIDHLSSRIDIQGVGAFSIVSPTRTFVNYRDGLVGYSRNSLVPGQDLYDGPANGQFTTWHMQSSIGPIEGYAQLFQWDAEDVQTDGGVLFFDGDYQPTIFQAILLDSFTPGDADHDGNVDLEDLNLVRNHFGTSGADLPGDTNDDDMVDLEDLNDVRNHFGAVAGAAAVPEPSALVISVVLASTMLVRRRIVLMLCAFFALTVCNRSPSMAATFRFLPEYPAEQSWTVPTSVTNQGDVILGNAYSRAQRAWGTFAWSDAQGIGSPAELGLPTGSMYVSADGGHIAGAELHLGAPEQFLWSPASGKQFLGNLPGTSLAIVTGISEQAATVVGWNIIDGVMAPTIWTSTTGIRLLNTSQGVGGVAFSVSDDGKVVVGKVDSFRQQAARWTSVDTCELIPDLPETVHSWAADTSDDGSRVVGYMGTTSGETAFLWDEGIGTKSLFGGQSNWIGSATAISGDGLLIGGSYSGPSIQKSAFVWSEATGMKRLHDLVEELGYDLGEWRLDELTDISRNGRFVTGAASGPSGYRGFLIDLHPSLTGDTNADGIVDLEDLNNVRNTFGQSGDAAGDTNDDGVVDLVDLNNVRNHFGAGAATVPEPDSLSLIVLSCTMIGFWFIARRRSFNTRAQVN